MKILYTILTIAAIGFLCSGCKKYLDAKPDGALAIPTSLNDFQALLDFYPKMNTSGSGLDEISTDDYFLNDADLNTIAPELHGNLYRWQKNVVYSPGNTEWYYTYIPVFTANTILEGLQKLNTSGKEFDNVKGQACYYRAKSFLSAAIIWAPAYDKANAEAQIGIPIRLQSDFNVESRRSTLKETYDQIVADLKIAAALLPKTPIHLLRPSKAAAYGMLARTYLIMQDYQRSFIYADSCLQMKKTLLDFNKLNANAAFPISRFNNEVIHEFSIGTPAILFNTRARIKPAIYAMYENNDLRKTVFFKDMTGGDHAFKGNYEGGFDLFYGVATDEMLLIRAECNARAGNTSQTLVDLNFLLVSRYKLGTFVPLTASNSQVALDLVLTERRKELLMRGLRWADIKRLNTEGRNISLTRSNNGETYTLPAGDLRFVLPIPDDIIALTGMQQNPR
jgi:hypothetical protein